MKPLRASVAALAAISAAVLALLVSSALAADRTLSGQELAGYAALWEKSRADGNVVSGTDNIRNIEYFVGFVTGVAMATMNGVWCPSTPISTGQIWAVTAKYLREHPEQWHLHSDHLVQMGLREAFPCPSKKPKSGDRKPLAK